MSSVLVTSCIFMMQLEFHLNCNPSLDCDRRGNESNEKSVPSHLTHLETTNIRFSLDNEFRCVIIAEFRCVIIA